MQDLSSVELSKAARLLVLKMIFESKSSHIGSSFSVIDILSVLYSGSANITPENYGNMESDVVILSKGHAAAAMYAILALKDFLDLDKVASYCIDGSSLGGHITSKNNIGIELATGSLGHGFPYGLGIAISQQKQNVGSRTFVILSDGECDEGTTWESALIASHQRLNNLFVIIDRNRLQSIKNTEQTIALEPLRTKWEAFNWEVIEIDGHSHSDLNDSFKFNTRPTCIIANTVKGKGVSFMENDNNWHYKYPTPEEYIQAKSEIENS